MINVTTTRMLLSTAALAAIAALFAGAANATVQEPSGHPPPVGLIGDSAPRVDRAVAAANEAYDTYRDKSAAAARAALFTDRQPSVGLTGDSALTRSSAPQSLTHSSAPQSAGLTGDSPVTYPGRYHPAVAGTTTLPTASSASDGVDWSWFGLAAGMAALLAAGIAGVVLTTRRRGGVALP